MAGHRTIHETGTDQTMILEGTEGMRVDQAGNIRGGIASP